MDNQNQSSRRKFLQQIGATSLLAAASPFASLAAKEKAEERILRYERKFSPNDKIRLGVIGFGVQGHLRLTGNVAGTGCRTGRYLRFIYWTY